MTTESEQHESVCVSCGGFRSSPHHDGRCQVCGSRPHQFIPAPVVPSDERAVLTMDEARKAGMQGWNLRCNRCGSYGARWVPDERPGWGALALCPAHDEELKAEHKRHYAALRTLREVNFEQPR